MKSNLEEKKKRKWKNGLSITPFITQKKDAGDVEKGIENFNALMSTGSPTAGMMESARNNLLDVEFYEANNGHNYALEYIEDLKKENPKLCGKLLRNIDIFRRQRRAVSKDISKYLKDGIYEIRAKQGNNISRVLHFFVIGNKIIITNGYTKKQQKLDPKIFEQAKKLMKEYNKEIENENS